MCASWMHVRGAGLARLACSALRRNPSLIRFPSKALLISFSYSDQRMVSSCCVKQSLAIITSACTTLTSWDRMPSFFAQLRSLACASVGVTETTIKQSLLFSAALASSCFTSFADTAAGFSAEYAILKRTRVQSPNLFMSSWPGA